jgi:hypothetical protein
MQGRKRRRQQRQRRQRQQRRRLQKRRRRLVTTATKAKAIPARPAGPWPTVQLDPAILSEELLLLNSVRMTSDLFNGYTTFFT